MIVAGSSGAAARLAVVALSGFVSYTTANSFNTTCNKKGTTGGGGGGEAYPTACQKNLSMSEVLLNGEVPVKGDTSTRKVGSWTNSENP